MVKLPGQQMNFFFPIASLSLPPTLLFLPFPTLLSLSLSCFNAPNWFRFFTQTSMAQVSRVIFWIFFLTIKKNVHCDWLLYCRSTNEKYLLLTLLWGPEKLYYWAGRLQPYLSVPSGMGSTHCSKWWHRSKCIICLPCVLQILHL